MRLFVTLLCAMLIATACSSNQKGDDAMDQKLQKLPPLVPREVLFGNPVKAAVRISPDGTRLSYIAPSDKNVLNVWVRTIGQNDDKMVTKDEYRGIRSYGWAWNDKQIVYIQDTNGDENFHLYAVDLATLETKDLTPFPGVRAQGIISDRKHPDEIYIGLNKRDPAVFDIYKLNLVTGELTIDAENPGDVEGWVTDRDFTIRAAVASNLETADTILRIRDGKDAPWRDFMTIPFGENGSIVDFTENNKTLLIETSVGSDTTRLVEYDPATGAELRLIAQNPKADVGGIMLHPETSAVQAVRFTYLREEWQVFDPLVKADIDILEKVREGDLFVVNRDRADTKWIVGFELDNAPYSFYLYDRTTKKAEFLFTHQPELEKYKLATMKPVVIKSRDGLDLVSYLTLPVGIEPKSLPLILYVHGGPWHRDGWGYDPGAQWFANRGYAALQVNFRGSTGFGKNFVNAGNGEWGVGKMQHDLTDAVQWAIKEGIADPKKVAIFGGSYGGYATLAGLAFTPEIYACGVDIVGPSNLQTLMATIPAYWKPFKMQMLRRIGDVENDQEFNKKISPLFHVDAIRAPLMIGQGQNDPRVKVAESDQIVAAMRAKNIPVTYILYPDEGHGFARPENRMDFNGRAEQFLAQCLGGRAEPYEKKEGTTAQEK
ncbi:MAG TPA: S9 family peptidase [bacterium]|nr:S9 family peptidase [bacterium]